jgi:hypothetical protein
MNTTYYQHFVPYHVRRAALKRGHAYVPLALAAPVTLPAPPAPAPAFFRTRKVGGLRFIWCGRLVMSFCIKRGR